MPFRTITSPQSDCFTRKFILKLILITIWEINFWWKQSTNEYLNSETEPQINGGSDARNGSEQKCDDDKADHDRDKITIDAELSVDTVITGQALPESTPMTATNQSNNVSIEPFKTISNRLALKLYLFMSSVYPNFMFSPINLSLVLLLLLRASSGDSYNEIYEALQLNNSANLTTIQDSVSHAIYYFKHPLAVSSINGIELELSNGICLRDGTKVITTFLTEANKIFGTKIKGINFKLGIKRTDRKLAKWFAHFTRSSLLRNQIALDPITEDTNAVIFNSLYLSAVTHIHNGLLIRSDFYALGSRVIRTQFVQKTDKFNISHSDMFKSTFIEIPFRSEDEKIISLIIVRPNANYSLDSVEKIIASNGDQFLTEIAINMTLRSVNVVLPYKFIRPQVWRMDRILPHIGIKSIFQPETSLLTKISGLESISISRMYDETYVNFKKINNVFHAKMATNSTEEALQSATESDFIANRPFLYAIIERKSSAIILMGKITII